MRCPFQPSLTGYKGTPTRLEFGWGNSSSYDLRQLVKSDQSNYNPINEDAFYYETKKRYVKDS